VALRHPAGVETQFECAATGAIAGHLTSTIPDAGTSPRVRLCLAPGRSVVVGRADEHHHVPYLDPAYQSTTVVPGTGQTVLRFDGREKDTHVSRSHFTLRGSEGGGIVLTNGVPGVDGGIRPPTNWTCLLAPEWRVLDPGEELLIERGGVVVIQLPNDCVLQLAAQ
jgi:hypothetical protein